MSLMPMPEIFRWKSRRFVLNHKFYQKRNFGDIKTDSNVSWISPKTSVELSEVSVDFSERNVSVAKTRNFKLLCSSETLGE
jgi:hypothetical protein